MLLIPAMDIRDGKFVHLLSDPVHEELVGEDNPLKVAQWWKKQGARLLHLTDLDGAFTGMPENLDIIEAVAQLGIPIQVSGGIRSLKHIEEVFQAGARQVIFSVTPTKNMDLVATACQTFKDRVIIGIQGKNNKIAGEGWRQITEWQIIDFVKKLKECGVETILYSDTMREGSLKGPNLELAKKLAEKTGINVILSGGVSSIKDLEHIQACKSIGISGVIIGKAFYTGAIDFQEAQTLISNFK